MLRHLDLNTCAGKLKRSLHSSDFPCGGQLLRSLQRQHGLSGNTGATAAVNSNSKKRLNPRKQSRSRPQGKESIFFGLQNRDDRGRVRLWTASSPGVMKSMKVALSYTDAGAPKSAFKM